MSGTLVTFESSVLDVGNVYDSSSSTFTAPYDGYYALNYKIYASSNDGRNSPKFYINGVVNNDGGVTAAGNGGATVQETTGRLLVELSEGDEVTVHDIGSAGTADICSISSTNWASTMCEFSGHLIATTSESNVVVFHATNTASQTNIVSAELILFQSSSLNIGGGYSTSTSTFTAPYDGYYDLRYTVYSSTNDDPVCPSFWINGVIEEDAGQSFAGTGGVSYQEASGRLLVLLSKDDYVQVRQNSRESGTTADISSTYTDFSGHLIATTSKSNVVAFQAQATSVQSNIAGGDKVSFDSTAINIGGGYDSSTSTFTAPYDGYYDLAYNVWSSGHNAAIRPVFYINGVQYTQGGQSYAGTESDSVTTEANNGRLLAQLSQGDTVAVHESSLTTTSTGDVCGVSAALWANTLCEFSGSLIKGPSGLLNGNTGISGTLPSGM